MGTRLSSIPITSARLQIFLFPPPGYFVYLLMVSLLPFPSFSHPLSFLLQN